MSGLFSSLLKTKTTSLQVVSNLQLYGDQYEEFIIEPLAPYLVLAGSTGRLADFMSYLSFLTRHAQLFSRIFILLGPWELHSITPSEAAVRAEQLVSADQLGDRVTLLDRTKFHLVSANLTLVGCTLWPYVAPGSKLPVNVGSEGTREILDWSADLQNEKNVRDFRWLRNKVRSLARDKPKGARTLVLTTYAPVEEQINMASQWDEVEVWIHGFSDADGARRAGSIKVVACKQHTGEEFNAANTGGFGTVIRL